MGPDKNGRYDLVAPIPSYDEAVAGGSRSTYQGGWQVRNSSRSPVEERTEGASLLNTNAATASSRRNGGYRPPTVETDDEESLYGSESESDDEAAQVRREMQEMDIMDPETDSDRRARSTWGKRIAFSLPLLLSLPEIAWRLWREWRWPWRIPRFRIRLDPDRGGSGDDDGGSDRPRRWRFTCPDISKSAGFLLVGRMLALSLVLGFLYLLFVSDLFTGMARQMGSQMFDPESVRMHVQSAVEPRRIREKLKHFTSYAHMAGTEGDWALAVDTKNLFEKFGLEDVSVDEYHVYLNYPKAGGRAVEILGDDGRPTWTAKLEEDEMGGETAGHQTPAFHGHSKSGDVKGHLMYANYGSRDDFKRLQDSGIETHGAIALLRYGGSQKDGALKVKAAEQAGFAACLIYSDPADDGFLRGHTAPQGRYMPAGGVQRGSVSLTGWLVGDVLTPGWGSKKDMPRMRRDQTKGLTGIPSLPLAWRDAQTLLQHLRGHGQKVPDGWAGGVPDVGEWWTGDRSSPIVRLRNEQGENEKQPIWNIYGRIVGVEQHEKKVMVGNHRDAWAFGAADPHSGTAVMLELARIFGALLARGWRPLRTIEFMSWDAGAYNLIGSTEYVEQNDEALREDGMAYINLGTAVTGESFHASGSPVFRKLLLQILNRVGDPHYNTTLRHLWDSRKAELDGLGADSDYVAFQDIVGTSSIDLHFDGPGFPTHSSFENFEWMEQVGDPGFVYHTLLAQIAGLLVLDLADRPILPFDLSHYADSVGAYVRGLASWSESKAANRDDDRPLDLSPLTAAADELAKSTREHNQWETGWENSVLAANGWEPIGLGQKRNEYNSRMAHFETDLLDLAGIPNRTQFKHVLFGPQLWPGYEQAYFPAIVDAVMAGDWDLANATVHRVASIIKSAATNLLG